jgi:hypothetical protein
VRPGTIEDHVLLQDVVKIDMQAIEDGNRAPAVFVGPELQVIEGLQDRHRTLDRRCAAFLLKQRQRHSLVSTIAVAIHAFSGRFAVCPLRAGLTRPPPVRQPVK